MTRTLKKLVGPAGAETVMIGGSDGTYNANLRLQLRPSGERGAVLSIHKGNLSMECMVLDGAGIEDLALCLADYVVNVLRKGGGA